MYNTINISREENKLVRAMLDDTLASYKNWIVSAVERNDFDYAKQLTGELAKRRALCHVFVPDDMFEAKCKAN